MFEQSIKMPEWLESAIKLAFKQKNVDFVKGYTRLWNDMRKEATN